ncbi:hypothetical protein EW145_g1360 [Phellinidium pouzarii]|uniref:Ribosomal protein S15 n=1 Tax=Phellinidium pouzarii TaxID=167371 RepID=A0A4S4LES9_9AGAM|nr:hypothetical protein EW145_g1360 [Phellinidium pouzarii]
MSFLRVSTSLGLASSSTSTHCWPTIHSVAALHTSAARFAAETQKQRHSRVSRQTNVERKTERAHFKDENKPHVVLGTRPGDEAKWLNCDLRKVLVTAEELASLPPPPTGGDVQPPLYANFGLDGLDGVESLDYQKKFFFEHLPDATKYSEIAPEIADKLVAVDGAVKLLNPEDVRMYLTVQDKELEKARQLARMVDLRNANARGIAFENRRRIIAAFSPTGNTSDSGYPEVQVALLTMKIRNVWSHLLERKKDLHGRRAVRLLVHQRAKMLKYIKRIDRDRYDRILQRVALEPESVEGELVV